MYIIPSKLLKNRLSSNEKYVFRTTRNYKIPYSMFSNCHQKWVDMNPSYTVVWYDHDQRDRFMKTHYDGAINDAYKLLIPPAFKADLWRLCILYKFGGVYIDAYATPHVSLDKMVSIANGAKFISILDCKSLGGGIHNGFIIAERKHPFLKQAMFDIIENVSNRYYGNSPLDVTGPNALKKSIMKITGKEPIEGNNKLYYLFRHEYGPYQNIYYRNTLVMQKQYSFIAYFYNKMSNNKDYSRLWKNRNIYSIKT